MNHAIVSCFSADRTAMTWVASQIRSIDPAGPAAYADTLLAPFPVRSGTRF
jgi:hypothetical protein